MDANIKVPALEKLLDLTASGVGSIAGPMLAPWKARREAEARQIAAQGEANARKILATGEAGATQIIVAAQAQARAQLISPGSAIRGELDIAETVNQRIQFQEEKRQRNIGAVVSHAAAELGDKDVPNNETDHDWTARFFNGVQDVSSEDMQLLWARVLAGEVERAGSTSMRTLSILRNFDKTTAEIFKKLCSLIIIRYIDNNDHIFDAMVLSLEGDPGNNALQSYGLSFPVLNILNEHGVIIPTYHSSSNYRTSVIAPAPGSEAREALCIPFKYQGNCWLLSPVSGNSIGKDLWLSGVALTESGKELLKVVDVERMSDYTNDLVEFFEGKQLEMIETPIRGPQCVRISPQT